MKFWLLMMLLAGSVLSAAELKPETSPVNLTGGNINLTAYTTGNTILRSKTQSWFNVFLGVHWSYAQFNEDTSRAVYRYGDGVRITGKILNVDYVEDITLQDNTAEIKYSVIWNADNPFGQTRQWEIWPVITQPLSEQFKECRYALTTASGLKTEGRYGDPIPKLKDVTSFTLFNAGGFDVTLLFEGPTELMDRRGEEKPAGVWFFQPVRNAAGQPPVRAGERGEVKFQFQAGPAGTAVVPTATPAAAKAADSSPASDGINHLWNPGFERETNPGYADGWGPFYHNWPGWGEVSNLMDWSTFIAVDKYKAFEGKNSLRMILPERMTELTCQHPYIRTMPGNTDAVWSVYAQSDAPDGGTFTLAIRPMYSGDAWTRKTFTVGPEWTRFELPFRTPKSERFQPWITLNRGMVRFDAMQIESGTRATAYRDPMQSRKAASLAAAKRDVPEFRIPMLSREPVLEKLLDDPIWREAVKLDRFYVIHTKTPVKNNETIVFAGIHGSTLYLAAECKGKNRPPLQKERDSFVWTDDSLELFLDPGAPELLTASDAVHSYYHIVVNALGTIYDIYHGAELKLFDGKIRTHSSRTESDWKVILALDLAALPYSPVTANWRLNLAREDHTNNQYSSLMPDVAKFHDYSAFPRVSIPEPVIEKLNRFAIRKLEASNGKVFLNIASEKAEKARISCVAGSREVALQAGPNKVEFAMAEIPANLKTTVEVAAADGAKTVRDFEVITTGEQYFRRNFYTDEKEAEIIWGGQPLPPSGAEAKIGSTSVILTVRDGRVFTDIAKIPEGNHTFVYGSLSLPFQKLPPVKGEVKIDRLSCMMLVDGEPFIMYGPWNLPFGPMTQYLSLDYTLPTLKKLGANVVAVGIPEGRSDSNTWALKNKLWDIEAYRKILDRCHELGLKVYLECSSGYKIDKDYRKILPLEKLVPELRDHPALLMWYIADEPEKVHAPEVWRRYHLVKKLDPHHPVMVDTTSHGLASRVITDPVTGKNACDVLSITYYPVGCSMYADPEGPMGNTSIAFRDAFQLIRANHGVMIHAAQAYGYGVDFWYRTPTPDELEFLIYMPLIYGNRGWGWFGGRAPCRATDDRIWELGAELKRLAPVLGVEGAGEVLTSGSVIGILRKYEDAWYLITVNTSEKPENVTFQLGGELPADCDKAEVMFENRALKLSKGTITDAYKAYGRHVYRIPAPPQTKTLSRTENKMQKKLLLIGDSIREGYQKEVIRILGDEWKVSYPNENARFAKYTFNNLKDWLPQGETFDVIHWNNGLWDSAIVYPEDGMFTPTDEYLRYMRLTLRELRKHSPRVIFATTTPVREGSINQKLEFVQALNKTILPVMAEEKVTVNDLYSLVMEQGLERMISNDRIHLSAYGKEVCGKAVAEAVKNAIKETK